MAKPASKRPKSAISRQLAHQHGLRWYKAGGWVEITDMKTIALLERAPRANPQ